jgi:hypothetical protein
MGWILLLGILVTTGAVNDTGWERPTQIEPVIDTIEVTEVVYAGNDYISGYDYLTATTQPVCEMIEVETMKYKVYMLEDQGTYATEEEAKKRKEALEKVYKKLKFEIREE